VCVTSGYDVKTIQRLDMVSQAEGFIALPQVINDQERKYVAVCSATVRRRAYRRQSHATFDDLICEISCQCKYSFSRNDTSSRILLGSNANPARKTTTCSEYGLFCCGAASIKLIAAQSLACSFAKLRGNSR